MWHQGVMRKPNRLSDAYKFDGFVPLSKIRGIFGEPLARIITLQRRGKKRSAEVVAEVFASFTTERPAWSATRGAGTFISIWNSKYDALHARIAA
jgi:hypothetical protein